MTDKETGSDLARNPAKRPFGLGAVGSNPARGSIILVSLSENSRFVRRLDFA
jgi:hypothetical protein